MNASSSLRVTSTNVSSSFLVDILMISGGAFVSFIVHTSGSAVDPSWFCVPGRGNTMKLCWRWAFSGTERQNMASTSSPRTVYSTALVAWFSKRICRIFGLEASWRYETDVFALEIDSWRARDFMAAILSGKGPIRYLGRLFQFAFLASRLC
jgi:hypothetical protein